MRYLNTIFAVLVIGLVPVLYAGAYLAMIDKQCFGGGNSWPYLLQPQYRCNTDLCEMVLYPAHVVDRWLRPGTWGHERFIRAPERLPKLFLRGNDVEND